MGVDKEMLLIEANFDPSKAIQMVDKFESRLSKNIQKVQRGISSIDKRSRGMWRETTDAIREADKGYQDVRDAMKDVEGEIKDVTKEMERLNSEIARGGDDESQKTMLAALKSQQREMKMLTAARDKMQGKAKEMFDTEYEVKVKAIGEGLGKDLKESTQIFSSLASKDIPGAFGEGAKIIGAVLHKGVGGLGKGVGKFGDILGRGGARAMGRGQELRAKGGAGNAMKGLGLQGLGGLTKMFGGIFKAVGPILGTVAKLGPILSATAGIIVGIVKLFIDAESQAKGFQKDILSAASTTEFLGRNAHDAVAAYADLAETVTDIRNAAYDAKRNLDWGTTSDEHKAFWNTLNQEGVSIKAMREEFEAAKKSGLGAAHAVDFYGEAVATAVAYSRNFGVSLNDITTMQGELMREMGIGIDSVEEKFAEMSRGAAESGIAANKFFSIIRSVTADLSLYNMRMDDAVHLLTALGKTMSARSAEKFMQTLSQGFKNMGRLERLRMTLLAGPGKTRAVVEKSQKSREDALVKEIASKTKLDPKEIQSAVQAHSAGKGGALRKMLKGVESGGALREAAIELKIDKRMAKKGLFGLSQSIGNLTGGSMIEMSKAALGRFSKEKTLGGMVGEIGPEMMAENLGISREQLNNMVKMEEAIQDQREELVEDGKLTQEQVNKMSDDEILTTMGDVGKNMKESLKTEKDYARQQAELTSSLMDKLGVLIDFVMNQIYNVLLDIFDLMPGSGSKAQTAKAVARTKNMELQKAWGESQGDVGAFKGRAIMETTMGKRAGGLLEGHGKETQLRKEKADAERGVRDAMQKMQSAATPEGYVAARNEMDKYNEALKKNAEALKQAAVDGDDYVKLQSSINTEFQNSGDAIERSQSAFKILSDAKIGGTPDNPDRVLKLQQGVAGGKSLSDAAREAGFSEEEIGKIMAKALWELKPEQVATVLGGVKGGAKPEAAATTAAGTPPAATTPAATTPAPTSPTATTPTTPPTGVTPAQVKAATLPGGVTLPPAAASTATPKTPEAKGIKEGNALTSELQQTSQDTQDMFWQVSRQKGFKLDKPWTSDVLGGVMEKSMLDALRVALFEYYMYSGLKRDDVAEQFAAGGFTPKDFASRFTEEVGKGTKIDDTLKTLVAPKNAEGGYVTDVSGGMARVIKPPPGEGFASVGPGETVMPAGARPGGGGSTTNNIDVTVQGGAYGQDFSGFLKAKIADAIYEYDRRRKYS